MATFNSNKYGDNKPVLAPVGTGPVSVLAFVALAAGTGGKLSDGDILNLCVIPQGATITGLTVFSNDLDDGTAALVFDVGLLDAGDAALDTVFVSGSTLGQAGGTLAVPATVTMFSHGELAADKVLAIEVTTTANGDPAADSKIGVVVTYVM